MSSLIQRSYCTALLVAAGLAWQAASAAAAADTPRPASQQEYWAQFDQRDWAAAVKEAETLVAAAREKSDKKPLALAEALTLLGNAQLGKADLISAEAAYTEALKIVEQHAGSTSARLLDPLRGLGYTLAAAGRDEEAVPHLDRGLLIAHRSYGLFDPGQQGILRQLATSLTRLGRGPEAERHVYYMLRLGERAYGPNDPRMVPILCFVGDWYATTGNFPPARASYRTAVAIVDKSLGKQHLAAVQPLQALARSYTQEVAYSMRGLRVPRERMAPTDADGTSNDSKPLNPRYISVDGEKALDRALKIVQANAQAPRTMLSDTLIQLGDWYQIKHQPEKALPFYRQAAALDTASPAGESDNAARPLSFPVLVYYPLPSLATRNLLLPPDQVEERFVQVEFTVTNDGGVANAKVTDENGTSRQVAEALQAIRAARFRPKFVNGEPVETTGMINREVFKTRKTEGDVGKQASSS